MKKLLLVVFLTTTVATFAQSSSKEDLDIIQGVYGKSKKELAVAFMNLAEPQSSAFFKIYDAYEVERKALGAKKVEIIESYAKDYYTLTDEKADVLAKATLKNNADFEKLLSKYYNNVKKAVGALNATKFIQLEIYLQTAVRSELQEAVPFIGELDKTKQ
jgi:methanogenic corrinoid protein MtbC1